MIRNLSEINVRNKKAASLAIFIIIAILLVGAIVLVYLLRDAFTISTLPKEVRPVYDYFSSCIEEETRMAALTMGSQAGYLQLPEFEPGSDYMPFSSQLDFMGAVPYWYYVSGNGIAKEQIPGKKKMEEQLRLYLKERIDECSFSAFEQNGFTVEKGDIDVGVTIEDTKINVDAIMPLTVSFGDRRGTKTEHKVTVDSKLGKFYNLASEIYNKEQKTEFLENYGVDILRLYAPVDGSDLGCAPKVWSKSAVRENLTSALEANTQAIKIKGDYYSLGKEENKYFVQDLGERTEEEVNFLYLRNWPMKFEVWPSESNILMAEPVGLQEGLGILGFCYVPYHFVYDFSYPVLIQIYDGEEIFQFPVAVVIDKNTPRKAPDVEGLPEVVPELCGHKLTKMNISTYNTQLDPVPASIKYKCFDTSCYIGDTVIEGEDAILTANFPQCINGYIIADAEGYKTAKLVQSTVEPSESLLILDKKYNLELEVTKEGSSLNDEYAIVTFTGEDTLTTVYPEQKNIELTAGEYEVKVYVYTNSTITLAGSKTEKCIEVAKSGISGVFGATDEKCFTLEIPEQVVSFAVSGGGTQKYYVTEDPELQSGKLKIDATNFGKPTKVEDLQENYNKIQTEGLDIQFG